MLFKNILKVMEFIQRHSGPKKSCNNFDSLYSLLLWQQLTTRMLCLIIFFKDLTISSSHFLFSLRPALAFICFVDAICNLTMLAFKPTSSRQDSQNSLPAETHRFSSGNSLAFWTCESDLGLQLDDGCFLRLSSCGGFRAIFRFLVKSSFFGALRCSRNEITEPDSDESSCTLPSSSKVLYSDSFE